MGDLLQLLQLIFEAGQVQLQRPKHANIVTKRHCSKGKARKYLSVSVLISESMVCDLCDENSGFAVGNSEVGLRGSKSPALWPRWRLKAMVDVRRG